MRLSTFGAGTHRIRGLCERSGRQQLERMGNALVGSSPEVWVRGQVVEAVGLLEKCDEEQSPCRAGSAATTDLACCRLGMKRARTQDGSLLSPRALFLLCSATLTTTVALGFTKMPPLYQGFFISACALSGLTYSTPPCAQRAQHSPRALVLTEW